MKFDVAIVLGYTGPSEKTILESRLEKCLELFRKKIVKDIIVAGRHESKTMLEYLLAHKVPRKNIFVENHSTDTFGNAFFSMLLFILPKKWKNLAVVTSDFHENRTQFIFKRIFHGNYKLKFFMSKTKIDPLTLDTLVIREDLALAADELLLNNLHLILMKEQK